MEMDHLTPLLIVADESHQSLLLQVKRLFGLTKTSMLKRQQFSRAIALVVMPERSSESLPKGGHGANPWP